MSRRRSRSSFERRLDELEGSRSEYPEASLATMLSAENAGECDDVAGEPGLIRCFGDVYRVSPTVGNVLGETADREDP